MSSGVLAIDIAYAFGMVAVVPMGVWLLGGKAGGAVGAAMLGAIGAAGLFMVPANFHGSFLMTPWAIFVVVLAVVEVVAFLRTLREPGFLVRVVRVAAPVFLAVSVASALALRWELKPFGFPALVVALTAVHYLFTGFGAVLFSWKASAWEQIPNARAALVGSFLVLGGTPVIAGGITIRQVTGIEFFSVGEALGAVMLAVGLVMVAWQVFRGVAGSSDLPAGARFLLRVPMAVVVVSMGLAVLYGLHRWLGTPALDERMMAETHGMLNAFGLVACGLLGWILVERVPVAAVEPEALEATTT